MDHCQSKDGNHLSPPPLLLLTPLCQILLSLTDSSASNHIKHPIPIHPQKLLLTLSSRSLPPVAAALPRGNAEALSIGQLGMMHVRECKCFFLQQVFFFSIMFVVFASCSWTLWGFLFPVSRVMSHGGCSVLSEVWCGRTDRGAERRMMISRRSRAGDRPANGVGLIQFVLAAERIMCALRLFCSCEAHRTNIIFSCWHIDIPFFLLDSSLLSRWLELIAHEPAIVFSVLAERKPPDHPVESKTYHTQSTVCNISCTYRYIHRDS